MTWAILSAGFFLCLFSGAVLRKVLKLRASYVRTLHNQGIQNAPVLPIQAGMLAGWGVALLAGLGLVAYGLSR